MGPNLMSATDATRTRTQLLERVRDPEDADGWSEFVRVYGGLIRRLGLKAGLTETEADDLLQEVLIGVHQNIAGFRYDRTRCSFKHWLTRMVRWRIIDRLRMRSADGAVPSPGSTEDEPGPEFHVPAELEAVWEKEWRGHQLERATEQLGATVREKAYQIYYLNVLRGMPVAEVRRRLKVTAAQVYVTKLRVGRVFRQIMEELRAADE